MGRIKNERSQPFCRNFWCASKNSKRREQYRRDEIDAIHSLEEFTKKIEQAEKSAEIKSTLFIQNQDLFTTDYLIRLANVFTNFANDSLAKGRSLEQNMRYYIPAYKIFGELQRRSANGDQVAASVAHSSSYADVCERMAYVFLDRAIRAKAQEDRALDHEEIATKQRERNNLEGEFITLFHQMASINPGSVETFVKNMAHRDNWSDEFKNRFEQALKIVQDEQKEAEESHRGFRR